MKIKTQFYLLIAGLILLPVLTIAAQAILRRLNAEPRLAAVPVYEEIERIGGPLDRKDWREVSRLIRQRRPGTGFAVFSDGLRVIYSTIPEFGAGETVERERIFELLEQNSPRYGWNIETPPRLAGGKFFILSKIDRAPSPEPLPPEPPPPEPAPHIAMEGNRQEGTALSGGDDGSGAQEQRRHIMISRPRLQNPAVFLSRWLLLIVGLVIVFALVMSFVIARSITQSVLAIEEVTRRIAAGELDANVSLSASKLFRSGNEITSLADSLNRMRLALKEEERRRARFIMGITHDLKTPLALIKGYTEAIADGMADDPAALKQSLAIIAGKSDQLETMINDLLNFIKIDTGEWRGALIPVNLAAFLSGYAERIRSDAELLRRAFASDIRLPPGLQVPMDTTLVIRALENLIGNALRYTPEGGLVRLSAWVEPDEPDEPGETAGQRAVIEVRDNGPGIAAADLPHVFETFYRGTSSRREPGMGLGLSVVKSVVETHGWTISVHSREDGIMGNGAAFRIAIPLDSKAP